MNTERTPTILTAGSSYLDIDAYACMVAMAELMRLEGAEAIAYSAAPCNYSVTPSLVREGQVARDLPSGLRPEDASYVIVDVSDPDFLADYLPLARVTAVYDHHVGFEQYWADRIGTGSHIEFLGAAATLIYREWNASGLLDKMSRDSALLLIAAILDNTLNLTSANTTAEDVAVFRDLCARHSVDDGWCAAYFTEVQTGVENDLKNAIFNDIKRIGDNPILPPLVGQLCVYDATRIIERLPEIRDWFAGIDGKWMLNIIDLHQKKSVFVCDDTEYQSRISDVFNTRFEAGVALVERSYLRKEIIKITYKYRG